ncbi:MAG: hypothetical protein PF692_14500 [Kiritimatiellae bacterium]|jgi:hypothetical protein|nr:hypothetical protein [Kiritimatiellia bacterium]
MKILYKILLLLALGMDADAEITNVLPEHSFDANKVQTSDSRASENNTASNGVVSKDVQVEKTLSPYYDFNRYKIILERKPFGNFDTLVLAPEPIKTPVSRPDFANYYSMCAITESYGNIMVGFIDKAKKNGKNYYYLRVGESQDGITLVEADYADESAKLSKDGQEFWINMTGLKLSNTSNSSSAQPLIAKTILIKVMNHLMPLA